MDKFSRKALTEKTKEVLETAHMGTIDPRGDVDVKILVRQRTVKLEPNIMVFQAFAYMAAVKLHESSLRVLFLFFSKAAFENFIGMDVLTIQEELKYPERTVIRALKQLQEYNIILKLKNETDKRRNDYFINPLAAWKGNSYVRKQQLTKIQKNNPSQLDLFLENSLLAMSKENPTELKP